MLATNQTVTNTGGPQPRLILVEGLPGSGKTFIAEWICEELRARGVKVRYHPELPRELSPIDGPIMKTARAPGYVDRCVSAWRDFSGDILAAPDASVRVVDGSFFQSTVRFLLEHRHPSGESVRYMAEAEQVLMPLAPRLLYLVHRDPSAYLREQVIGRKGANIISRIAAYTETTAWARENSVAGMEALFGFYVHYRQVCDELVDRSALDRLIEDTSDGDWSTLQSHVGDWLTPCWPV